MLERITILGDGAMATVCSILLCSNGHRVTMWTRMEETVERLAQSRDNSRLLKGVKIPAAVRITGNDADALADCTMILSAIPTQHMRGIWQRLRPHVQKGPAIVSVAKGIEIGTLLRPTQIIADVLCPGVECAWPLAALSGPNIAGEIARYLPATSVAASSDPTVAERVQACFATQWFRVYTNSDVIGVELAGAIKNVIAIAAGIIDGLAAGSNVKAALVTRGLVEIARLGTALGAAADTFNGLAGVGDLVTTCISPEGRNRSLGDQLGRGRKLDDILSSTHSVVEGVATTRAVVELARRYRVEMPIAESVHAILFENKDVLHALTDLMTREPKSERIGT